MTKLLSSLNNSLTLVPRPLTTALAGQTANAATNDIQPWLDKNWLECDGSAISRTTYADLFANIGTKFGIGDGSTTFNLPNGPRRTVEVELGSFAGFTASTQMAKAVFTQDTDNQWYIEWTITGTTSSSVSAVVLDFTSLGISFVWGTGPSNFQFFSGGNSSSNGNWGRVTGTNTVQLNGDIAATSWGSTARLKLTGKPTDAAVGADSRFSTFDEALESIPMIKAYDDTTNGASIGIPAATASTQGMVSLSQSFAAGDGVYGFVQANKFQEKILGSDISTASTTVFQFNSLTIGKAYELNFWGRVSAGTSTKIDIREGGVNQKRCSAENSVTSPLSIQYKFIASATDVELITNSSFDGTVIASDGGLNSTWATIEELSGTIETTDFT